VKNRILIQFRILLFLSFLSGGYLFCQESKSDAQGGSDINISDGRDLTSFSVMDSAARNYKVFFTGENHSFLRQNTKVELKMLRYLHQKAGVRIYLLEFGTSVGWLANKFIQTGDTSYLSDLKDKSYRDYTDLFLGLREFNKTLPDSEKIQVFGIDLEWSQPVACKALARFLPDTLAPPDSIRLSVESLRGLSRFLKADPETQKNTYPSYYFSGNYNIRNSLREIISNFRSHTADYSRYLAEDYAIFHKIIRGLENFRTWDEYEGSRMIQGMYYREQYMYEEFLGILKTYPDAKFFGQFGRCHVARQKQEEWCNGYDLSPLAGRINNSDNTLVRGKVCTIAIYYPNGGFMGNFSADEKKLKKLFPSNRREGFRIYDASKDTSVGSVITDKFNFIIVNFHPPEKEKKENISDDSSDPKQISKVYFDVFAESMNFDLSTFNNSIFGSPSTGIDPRQIFIGGGFTTQTPGRAFVGFRFAGMLERNFSNDSNDFTLRGWNFFYYSGINLTKSKIFSFGPGFGLGYQKIRLNASNNKNPGKGVFGEPEIRAYHNPAFLLDGFLDTRLTVGHVSLGLKSGYRLDLSQKDWKAGRELIQGGPHTEFSGFYFQGIFSLAFNSN
jgi:hypothetical protein